MSRIAALSVDLDEIGCYRAIHGLPVQQDEAAHVVYERALPRIAAFARAQSLPVTFFAVGRDLQRDASADALRRLSRELEAEVENHSLSHRYDLSRLARPAIAAEIRGGADVISEVTGRRPVGFRAPGYLVSDALFDVLADEGVAFDASVFPCPAYVMAKLGALGLMRLRGRRSRARVGEPWMMIAPAEPYRPGRPWHRPGGRPFVELPVAVGRGHRLPLIGTSVVLSGGWGATRLAGACVGRSWISFLLHGVDFLDAGDGLEDVARHQPDLRVPWREKIRRLEAAVARLKAGGYRFTTLAIAAKVFAER
jgi:hypothetical protein